MYLQGSEEFKHHLDVYGSQAQFGYKDFIPQFKAEHYDPAHWADLFHRAGAKFVVPVAEHHDGFAMYDSALTRWTAAKVGPKRDLVGELAAAVRAAGLTFGVSSHRAEHWWFMNGGRQFDSDVNDPQYVDFYGPAVVIDHPDPASRDWTPRPNASYLDDWLARCCELVDRYQPQLFWFDWWIEQIVFQPYVQKFTAYYYNRGAEWGKGVAINYKLQTFPTGAAVYDIERGQMAGIHPRLWQNDTSVSRNSWGYVSNQDYKTVEWLVGDLVDVVSKNGALLLNIGPRPDGTIPAPEEEILLGIGQWLAINGEAIYGTRPWKVFGEGPTPVSEGSFADTKRSPFTGQDFRFTTRGKTLYAIAMSWPGSEAVIKSLSTESGLWEGGIGGVRLLGYGAPLAYKRTAAGLSVSLPGEPPCKHAYILAISP
jgi:alpha-L-fucosidase